VIDFAVGTSGLVKVGDRVESGQPLVVLHANDEDTLAQAEKLVAEAFSFSDAPVEKAPLVADVIEG
jgi:thymidine phosphorylase